MFDYCSQLLCSFLEHVAGPLDQLEVTCLCSFANNSRTLRSVYSEVVLTLGIWYKLFGNLQPESVKIFIDLILQQC